MSDDPSERARAGGDPGDPPESDGTGDSEGPDGTGDAEASDGTGDVVGPDDTRGPVDGGRPGEPDDAEDLEALRQRVDQEYDFEEFGPADMARMSADEWAAAFDDETWVTGGRLLDRVEDDLRARIAERDVFAVVERAGGDRPRLVAYSDEGYAVVEADGSVEGRGTVLRDVKPSVALASMPEYEVPEPPEGAGLPAPEEVPDTGGGLGNAVIQFLAALMALAGFVLLSAAILADLGGAALVAVVLGLGFVAAGILLAVIVANARLSARYRAAEYRERLRRAGVAEGERPEFLPVDDREFEE